MGLSGGICAVTEGSNRAGEVVWGGCTTGGVGTGVGVRGGGCRRCGDLVTTEGK